jgi:hypothetical protein
MIYLASIKVVVCGGTFANNVPYFSFSSSWDAKFASPQKEHAMKRK